VGCGHAPPPASPTVQRAEEQRRARLPDDNRKTDSNWRDLRVKVQYRDQRAWAAVQVREPKVRFFYRPPETAEAPEQKADAETKGEATAKTEPGSAPAPSASPARAESDPAAAIPEALRKAVPFDVESIDVYGGDVTFVDMSKASKPELWLSDLEVSWENLASRPELAEERPVLLEAHAKVQHTGDLAVFISADPWSDRLNFSGRAVLQGLATKELYGFLAETADLQIPQGTLDLYVAFTLKDGHLTGGVKPLLRNADVRAASPGFFARTKAFIADHVLSIFSDRVPRRNAVATVIPLDGTINAPKADLLPTVIGVLYNAYLRGLAAGFGGLPPAKDHNVVSADIDIDVDVDVDLGAGASLPLAFRAGETVR